MSRKTILAIVCACAAACIAGALFLLNNLTVFQWQIREVQRIRSPDGKLDAVVLDGDAGAMTSTETYVTIIPSGGTVRIMHHHPSDTILEASRLKEFELKWQQPKQLEIHLVEARIDKFKNYWEIWEPDRGMPYTVDVRFTPGSAAFSKGN